ncbi:MAG: hypothetical protein ACLSAO_04145 [Anaerovoracaceae bacterium]
MKRLRAFTVMMLCVALLAFAGCGEDNTNDAVDDGTVMEETMDNTDNSDTNNDGSAMDKMKDDAKDAVDDMEDAVDGNDKATDATKNKQ